MSRSRKKTRREFITWGGACVAAAAGAAADRETPPSTASASADAGKISPLVVDPQPVFELSPYLYMQFMEPLGTTDGSVAAAWDFLGNRWRRDVVEVTQDLAPGLMRWGGCFSSYYRWREGVGPRGQRRPMHNLLWGGIESNQVGTVEFVDFCQEVGADPLMCVNFESDGRRRWMRANGEVRSGDAKEAADWVDYCNNPANALRREHGIEAPCRIGLWQIGNETSYDRRGLDCEAAARRTVAFAEAMRQADPSIDLIGWGDSDWAPRMLEMAGEHLQYIAFHHMFNLRAKPAFFRDGEYRQDPAAAWDILMDAYKPHAEKVQKVREQAAPYGVPLALTECHLALPGRNRCEILSSWAAGVAYARMHHVHERNGDVLKIATLADFCGTRWMVNAVMIPTPLRKGRGAFLMPVAGMMSLYRKHTGTQGAKVLEAPQVLDVTASVTGDRVFLHVANVNRTRPVTAGVAIQGHAIESGQVFEIAEDPEFEVMESTANRLSPVEKPFPAQGRYTFPAASVSAVELRICRAV